MDRWDAVRKSIEDYLGERATIKDRAYRSKREELAKDLGIEDVTLKGFLPAQTSKSKKPKSGTLGLDKVQRLLAKPEFQDLRRQFPELEPVAPQAEAYTEVQLKFEFEGLNATPQNRTLRLPVGKAGKVRVTVMRVG